MNQNAFIYRAQAVSWAAQMMERFFDLVSPEDHMLSSPLQAAAKAAIRDVRSWDASPTLELVAAIVRSGHVMAQAARSSKLAGRDDAGILRAVAACCYTAVRPAWEYWARVASNSVLGFFVNSARDQEQDHQSIDLARCTGRSLMDILGVPSWADLDPEIQQPHEGTHVWYGPPLLGRPTQVVSYCAAHFAYGDEDDEYADGEPDGTADENEDAAAAEQGQSDADEEFGMRVWEFPFFRDLYINRTLALFRTRRALLHGAWMISQWAPPLDHIDGYCAKLRLSEAEVAEMYQDRGEPLPAHYAVVPQTSPIRHRGPIFFGLPSRVTQRQNLKGRDEYVLDVWERHSYRRLTINSVEAIFPTLSDLQKFAHNASYVGSPLAEHGNVVDTVVPGKILTTLLPSMLLNVDQLTGDGLLRLRRELWAQSGWLPPTGDRKGGI